VRLIIDLTRDCYIFQQDGAAAHRARDTVALLVQETPQFIAPNMWPPNRPGLNPVDYVIWGVMEQLVYQVPIDNVGSTEVETRRSMEQFESKRDRRSK